MRILRKRARNVVETLSDEGREVSRCGKVMIHRIVTPSAEPIELAKGILHVLADETGCFLLKVNEFVYPLVGQPADLCCAALTLPFVLDEAGEAGQREIVPKCPRTEGGLLVICYWFQAYHFVEESQGNTTV